MIGEPQLNDRQKQLVKDLEHIYTECAKNNLTPGGYYGTPTLKDLITWLRIFMKYWKE